MSEISDNSMDDMMISSVISEKLKNEKRDETESQQVITDKQEYYEIMLVDGSEDLMNISQKIPIKLLKTGISESDALSMSTNDGNKLHRDFITSPANVSQPYTIPASRVLTSWRSKPEPRKSVSEPVKILPKLITNGSASSNKIVKIKRGVGRRKAEPPPVRTEPVKILPKITNSASLEQLISTDVPSNGPARILRLVTNPTKPESTRSEQIDNLIEKMLRENTNEIDVFFRSMAASVKKLQPNLIPKVKMEVCNVIAKYEMQSFEHGNK